MSAEATAKLAKPQLRGLLHSSTKIRLIAMALSVATVGVCVKLIHSDRRKKTYADFYLNYDIEKEFETMRKKGLFDSCPSD